MPPSTHVTQFEHLPIELIQKIVSNLDPLDATRFTSTCILYNESIQVDKRDNLIITNDNVTALYENFHQVIEKTVEELFYIGIWGSKEYYHNSLCSNVKLKFSRSPKNRCVFTITDSSCITPNYACIQLVYEPQYERYRFIIHKNNGTNKFEIPILLLYIGFKTLFEYHGYHYINKFENINIHGGVPGDHDLLFPEWFQRIIIDPDYNGIIYNSIIRGKLEF